VCIILISHDILASKGWIEWQISPLFGGSESLRYPHGNSCGTPNIPDLIKTSLTAYHTHKKTISLDSIKKFAKFKKNSWVVTVFDNLQIQFISKFE